VKKYHLEIISDGILEKEQAIFFVLVGKGEIVLLNILFCFFYDGGKK